MKHRFIYIIFAVLLCVFAGTNCSKENLVNKPSCNGCGMGGGQVDSPDEFFVYAVNWIGAPDSSYTNTFYNILSRKNARSNSISVYAVISQSNYEVSILERPFKYAYGSLWASVSGLDILIHFKPVDKGGLATGLYRMKFRIKIE